MPSLRELPPLNQSQLERSEPSTCQSVAYQGRALGWDFLQRPSQPGRAAISDGTVVGLGAGDRLGWKQIIQVGYQGDTGGTAATLSRAQGAGKRACARQSPAAMRRRGACGRRRVAVHAVSSPRGASSYRLVVEAVACGPGGGRTAGSATRHAPTPAAARRVAAAVARPGYALAGVQPRRQPYADGRLGRVLGQGTAPAVPAHHCRTWREAGSRSG